MSEVASPAVVAAGSVPAFVVADCALAEMMAPLAPWTTPERFQALIFELASSPEVIAHLKHRQARSAGEWQLTVKGPSKRRPDPVSD